MRGVKEGKKEGRIKSHFWASNIQTVTTLIPVFLLHNFKKSDHRFDREYSCSGLLVNNRSMALLQGKLK